MIGGTDIIIPTHLANGDALDVCVKAALIQWPSAVLQNCNDAKTYGRYDEIPFALVSELFVYRDNDALVAWTDQGASAGREHLMVHLLAHHGSGEVTCVVDDAKQPEIRALLEAIRDSLQDKERLVRSKAA